MTRYLLFVVIGTALFWGLYRLLLHKEHCLRLNRFFLLTTLALSLLIPLVHPTVPVSTHGDHRIAMAFGVLTLLYPDLVIEEPEQVSKSFPDFWTQLNAIRNNKETIQILQASKNVIR